MSITCKMIELIIGSNIMTHLEKHQVLADAQHDIHSKTSCESQLLIASEDILGVLDKGKQVDAIIIHLSFLFCPTPPTPTKMQTLYHTRFCLAVDSCLSVQLETKSGCQWLILWMWGSSPRNGVRSHTILGLHQYHLRNHLTYSSICRLLPFYIELQQELTCLSKWANDWQVKLNVAMCHAMHITRPCCRPKHHIYTMDGEAPGEATSEKYLLVLLHHDMN